ncbi:MAG: CinA family nicotinamide mononucleotide deamidase-related protein [Gemmatimonadota bacterium]|nr:CinA family nicotinamide mononucleotide deamidase-related protein [Gemmatimonadota bacterium]
MELEIVTVGTELLLGFTLDSNAADIARALAAVGARVTRRVTVGDDERAIRDAVAGSLRHTKLAVVTGGLGPTKDDVTKTAVARLFGAPLELDEAYLGALTRRFARFRRAPMPLSNRSQAEFPRGATRIPNARGTAPGLILQGPLGTAVLLPGVPAEMRQMLGDHVVPFIEGLMSREGHRGWPIRSHTLRTTGVTESGLADLLAALEPRLEGVSLAYLPGWEGVDLRLTAQVADRGEGEGEGDGDGPLLRAAARIQDAIGERYYGPGEVDLAEVVLAGLRARGWRLAVAESCTGGMVGSRLTAIPGASDVFVGGIIAYANDSKARDLGVPPVVLAAEGAVSEVVALAMAEGVAKRFHTESAIAVTGVAGPSGGTPEKPVGTVVVAARALERSVVRTLHLPGSRQEVRSRSTQAALDLLRLLRARS